MVDEYYGYLDCDALKFGTYLPKFLDNLVNPVYKEWIK